MQTVKKFRPEAEPPPEGPSDMEKNIANLRSLRTLRLTKIETDYRKKTQLVNQAKKNLATQMDKIQSLQIKTKQEKNQLLEKNLSQSTKPHELMHWMEYENKLDESIRESIQETVPLQKKVDEASVVAEQAKKLFRKAQLGIEKLDILKEELEKESE